VHGPSHGQSLAQAKKEPKKKHAVRQNKKWPRPPGWKVKLAKYFDKTTFDGPKTLKEFGKE